MLAGLIFATEEAEDRPGTLAATLPFGGVTLLEYQVRLLVGAGAGQILVAVARVTPALLGAVARAARCGVPVDIVRSAEEAAVKAHPLSRILVLADSLITTDPVIDRMASENDEALLVTDDAMSTAAIERLDMHHCWAGIATVPAHHLGAIARMPDDWDFQSALLRVAVESRARHVALTAGWERGGHGVERSADALASRSNAVLAALTERRTNWADRWVFTRIARLALPRLVSRGVPGTALVAGGGTLGVAALTSVGFGWAGVGAVVALLAVVLLSTSAAMAVLRGEDRRAALSEAGIAALFAGVVLLGGWRESLAKETATAAVLAVVLVVAQLMIERAPARPRRWWASPAAHLVLFAPAALSGFVTIGLAILAAYAAATLATAIESLRGENTPGE